MKYRKERMTVEELTRAFYTLREQIGWLSAAVATAVIINALLLLWVTQGG